MVTLRYKINGLGFRRSYPDDDSAWMAVASVLTEAGIDVFVKLPGRPGIANDSNRRRADPGSDAGGLDDSMLDGPGSIPPEFR